MTTKDNSTRLAELRSLFAKNNIGVYVVLTQDEHNSEYTSEADNRREFISGFTGSAGTAVVTEKKAALATDGRYFLQAGKELSNEWQLLKQGVKGVPSWQEFAAKEAAENKVNIGVDPKLITYDQVLLLKQKLADHGVPDALVGLDDNLIDQVWGNDKPSRSQAEAFVYPIEYSGKDFNEKIDDLRKVIKREDGQGFVVSALDDLAWLFNLRGTDIKYNPLFFGYSIVTPTEVNLYVDDNKITEKVRAHLGDSVNVKPYEQVFEDGKALYVGMVRDNAVDKQNKKLLLPKGCSWAMHRTCGGDKDTKVIKSPIEITKAVKNQTELKNMKQAYIKDGVAEIRFFSWLENALKNGEKMSDYEAGQKCFEFRKQMPGFFDLSFETISSSGPNAAIIHYAPPTDSKAMVDINQVYLLDSGAQFWEGTTDTTRTFHFGTPSEKEKESFTLVLKGHIAIAEAVFPEGSNGYMLDTFARQYLWKYGLDYGHGTSHGIGAMANVHEGPIGIGFRQNYLDAPFEIGNILSNEPGYYEDGKYGIRIESVVQVKEANTPNNFRNTKFHGFETITQVPLCKNLMNLDLMSKEEIEWVNKYHAGVYKACKSYFDKDESALKWLERECSPL